MIKLSLLLVVLPVVYRSQPGPKVMTIFMLIRTEHEIDHVHNC